MPVARLVAPTPEDVGVDSAALERVFARARREVDEGRLQACQVAVCRNGRLASMRSFGTRPDGGAVQDTDLFTLFSCTKAVLAIVMWQLIEQGLVDPQKRVADYIPGFGSHGKDLVSVLHVLNFTAGFPTPEGRLLSPSKFGDSAARCASFAEWATSWKPGSRWEYHPLSAHWVLAEIIERVTGVDWREHVRSALLDPAGLCDFFVGIPELQQQSRTFVGMSRRNESGHWDSSPVFGKPKTRALGAPGACGLATAADLALLYQPLLNGGEVFGGRRILDRHTIQQGTRRTTDGRHTDVMLAGSLADVMEPGEFEEFTRATEQMGTMPPLSHDILSKLTDRMVVVPKLRGWVLELAGDDLVTLTLPPEPQSADHKGLDLRAAFGNGAPVSAKVFRQGSFGFANSSGSFGHDGLHGQVGWGDPETGISFAFIHNTIDSREFSGKQSGRLIGMGMERIVEMGTLANAAAIMQPPCPCVVDGLRSLREMQERLHKAQAKL